MGPKAFRMSLSRLKTSQSTPPLFYNFIFSGGSKRERSASNRSKCGNSILRKRVYSFKHSGNLRGRHRGPEKLSPDRRSGRKNGRLLRTVHLRHKENTASNNPPVPRSPMFRRGGPLVPRTLSRLENDIFS